MIKISSLKTSFVITSIFFTFCSFSFSYDFAGGTGEPNDPYQIETAEQLLQIGSDPNLLDKCFILINDIDLDPNVTGLPAFTQAPIAPDTDIYHAWYTGTPFSGHFDGNGHVISNLKIIQNTYYVDHVGLFGEINGGIVENLGIENVEIILDDDSYAVGGLAGTNDGTVRNCYTTGTVENGLASLGGLVGYNDSTALIIDSYSACDISGRYDCKYLGGLVGHSNGRIERCYTTGYVSVVDSDSASIVGGLVGLNCSEIIYCYTTSIVLGWDNSYAVGGLVGRNNGIICYCYSSGFVSGISTTKNIGGLAGHNYYGKIENCYTATRISPVGITPSYVGQFVATNSSLSIIRNCFWDTSVWGVDHGVSVNNGTIVNLEGHPTESMNQQTTFTNGPAHWDFVGEQINGSSDDWGMPEGTGYPIHWWQLNPWPALPSFSGGSGNSENPYLISDFNDLNRICHNSRLMNQSFRLLNDIDCNDVNLFRIGSKLFPFSGTFDGGFHVLKNINLQSDLSEGIGFFSYLGWNGMIENLGLENIRLEVGPCQSAGAMIGISHGSVIQCFVNGNLVVGDNSAYIGGIVGLNHGVINYSFASMNISTGDNVSALGGFVGQNWSTILNCYSSGYVSSGINGRNIGGFVGLSIIGDNDLDKCLSWTLVTPGLSSISVGGFMGGHAEYVFPEGISCFWDTEASTMTDGVGNLEPDPNGVTGLPTEQMQTASTFIDAGWDFDDIWAICEGTNYPRLQWQILPADFFCPDGVDFLDYTHLSNFWLNENCADLNDCEGADFDLSGCVDSDDLKTFTDSWPEEHFSAPSSPPL